MGKKVKIGLMLGNEISMPDAFEGLLNHLNLKLDVDGEEFEFDSERVTVEPFSIRKERIYDVVIDRVSHWHITPREWLKKISFDGTYLLNDPFTFQSMEKHTGFSAMATLGLKIPETWLLPQKDQSKLLKEALELYSKMFDLDGIAEGIGYPLYMKPYDGGGWVGVSKVNNKEDLHKSYNESGTNSMHIQKAIDFDKFVRALCIGPQVLPMKYNPENPLHLRYELEENFLTEKEYNESLKIAKIINAFFGWEYNSCETLIKDDVIHPIDFSNAVPDSSIMSLHFNFPWIIKAMVKWSIFCGATGREFRWDKQTKKYLDIAKMDISYDEKLDKYEALADKFFETKKFNRFCKKYLPDFDKQAYEYFVSPEFFEVLKKEIMKKFPEHEHEEFIEHYRKLHEQWTDSEKSRLKL